MLTGYLHKMGSNHCKVRDSTPINVFGDILAKKLPQTQIILVTNQLGELHFVESHEIPWNFLLK